MIILIQVLCADLKFDNNIINWNIWCEIFQDIVYFTPIIERIFQIEKLGKIQIIRNVTPGTNAVFRVNDYIVKIFVPNEIKPWLENDYLIERDNALKAMKLNIRTPELINHGSISERYEWNYIIYPFIRGIEAKNCLKAYNRDEKAEFVRNIIDLIYKMRKLQSRTSYNDFLTKVIGNYRWEITQPSLREERINYIKKLKMGDFVFSHGDLTGENILIDQNKKIYIIDFGDSMFAPKFYDFPPIIFDLFYSDPFMTSIFLEFDNNYSMDIIFNGLLIHDFGMDIIKEYILKPENIDISCIKTLEEIHFVIKRRFNNG